MQSISFRIGGAWLVVAILILSAPGGRQWSRARAAENKDTCQFQNQLTALKDAQEKAQVIDYFEGQRLELNTRQNILRNTITCAAGEARSLQDTLGAVITNDSETKRLRDQLYDEVSRVLNYYQFQKTIIGGLDITATKNFARSLKDWRTENYLPLNERVSNFIVWVGNQSLTVIAQNRMNQVGQTVRTLELINNETVRSRFRQAEEHFRNAQEASQRMKEIGFRSSENTASDALTLAKTTLDELSQTYQSLLELSDTVNKLFPH